MYQNISSFFISIFHRQFKQFFSVENVAIALFVWPTNKMCGGALSHLTNLILYFHGSNFEAKNRVITERRKIDVKSFTVLSRPYYSCPYL